MNPRGPYRIEELSGAEVPEASAFTIDGAIELAKKLSRSKGEPVRVVFRERAERLIRGFARGGVWRWAHKCKPCGGKGEVAGYYGTGTRTCDDCRGTGVVEDDGRFGSAA